MTENPGVETDGLQPKKEFSPGQLLLQGRLQAGLTQEQVAKDLYMTVAKVKALETDDYSRLNSDTFARGYIRAYANLVKIDVVLVLAAYDQLIEGFKSKQLAIEPAVSTVESGHRGAWQFLAVIGAFFLGLWLISVWFFDNHSEAEYRVAAVNVSSAALVDTHSSSSSSLLTVNESSAALSSAANALNTLVPKAGVNSSVAQKLNVSASAQSFASSSWSASLVSESISSASSSKKVGLDEISFSFRAESWLEVSDSRGDVLATELEAAGSKIKLIGLAPFDVKLGNAPAVDIQLNGKKIDVIPLLGSNVLILKVGN